MKTSWRLSVVVLFLFCNLATAHVFRPFAFQVGYEGMGQNNNANVYGPYFALTPLLLDFKTFGLRLEAGTSRLTDASGVEYWTAFAGGYLRLPLTFFLFPPLDSVFNWEFGGGMETWWSRSGGPQPEATVNFLIHLPIFIDRITVGYTRLFIPNQPTALVKAGIGFVF